MLNGNGRKAEKLERVSCNLCGARQDLPVYRKVFYEVEYHIGKCAVCGLVYVNPRHFATEGDDYFRGPYLSTIEENGKLRSNIALIYDQVMRHIDAYLYPGRLLDVGCAMGHFMQFARARGWEATGVECSPYAAAWAREHFAGRTHAVCDLSAARFPSAHADAAVLIEVIEHLPNPRVTLAEVLRILKPGGIIYVTTPNFECYRSLLLREEWEPIIPTGHLYYFTSRTLGALLRSVGFTGVVDLGKPSSFEEDLEFARSTGKLRLEDHALDDLWRRLCAEDASKISNGRGEGLTFCAQKPLSGPGMPASRRTSAQNLEAMQGRVVQAFGPESRIYYVNDGARHWVTSTDWITRRGMRFPEDIVNVPLEEIRSIPEGPPV